MKTAPGVNSGLRKRVKIISVNYNIVDKTSVLRANNRCIVIPD